MGLRWTDPGHYGLGSPFGDLLHSPAEVAAAGESQAPRPPQIRIIGWTHRHNRGWLSNHTYGSISDMAKRKVTITLDADKAHRARSLTGAASTSGVIDLALDNLIRRRLLEDDIAAYRRTPSTSEDQQIAKHSDPPDLDDDTDWAALYADLP